MESAGISPANLSLIAKKSRQTIKKTQTRTLDIEYIFELDQLLVAFGTLLKQTEEGTQDRAPLNQGLNQLVTLIWQSCGFRFRRVGISSSLKFSYYYRCCQDVYLIKDSSSNRVRDRTQMCMFDYRKILQSSHPRLIELYL